MSNLHEQMHKDMLLRGFSPRIQYECLMNSECFEIDFSQRTENLGQDGRRDFPHYLINKQEAFQFMRRLCLQHAQVLLCQYPESPLGYAIDPKGQENPHTLGDFVKEECHAKVLD